MAKPVAVTDAEFEQAVLKSDLPVLVDFWADWCQPCKIIAPFVDELAGEYDGKVKFAKVDVDSNPATPMSYGIRGIPTLIIFQAGQAVEQVVGAVPKAELKKLIDRLPDGSLINIVFFAETTWCFARSPRRLDRTVRRAAAAYIDRQSYASGTNLYLALEKALTFTGSPDRGTLREDGLDTIVVLSDGRPTLGRLVDNELVARVTARRARYLRPVIHTVSLGAEARSLKLLSDLTGGTFRTR